MLVKYVNVARLDGVDLAIHVLNFAVTCNAIAGFQMVSILKHGFCASAYDRVTDCETHAIRLREQAMTGPISPFDKLIGLFDVGQAPDEHFNIPYVWLNLNWLPVGDPLWHQ
jgi:hypothetical protein